MKKTVLFALIPLLLVGCDNNPTTENEFKFNYWVEGATSLASLKNYMASITNKDATTYVPVEDRIAVFDMDGTVFGELFPTYFEYTMFVYRALEDPDYAPTAPEDVKAVAEEIRLGAPTHTYASDMNIRHGEAAAKAYSGMSLKQFAAYTKAFTTRNVPGFNNLTYSNAFYKPMVNVIDYLHSHDFQVYIVSGSDRYLCRELVRDAFHIPNNRVIGMDVNLVATHQDKDGVDYQFQSDDDVIRGDKLLIKNLKFNKVQAINKEIGKQPILSFGNTSGDQAMHVYTISNNKYTAQAYMLVADDGDRDNGGEKNEPLHQKWQDMGFHTISMKRDFDTIYGKEVTKIPANA